MDQLSRLLLAAQAGDEDALARFVTATQQDVLTMCRYLGDTDDYEDLAQEAYQRAFASLHRYRGDGPARNWLLSITRRTCADATRRRIRHRRLARIVHDGEPYTQPYDHATADLLGILDVDRRAAFVLTQLTGLRYDEAADVLDVPIGTIRSRVARAREQLIAAIAAADAAGEPDRRQARP